MPFRRTSVPCWKVIGTSEGIFRNTHLRCLTGSMKWVDLGKLHQHRNGMIIPELFYLLAKKKKKKRWDSRWLCGRLPGRRPPYWHADCIGPLPVALGGYKWVLTEIDTSLDWAFIPSDNANAQNTTKGLQKKMLYLFGLLSYISSG